MTLTNSPLQEDFQYIIEKFGELEAIRTMEVDEIERFAGKVPQAMRTFWHRYGLCQFHDGLLRLCHPDEMRAVLALAFDGDADLNAETSHVVAYSAFGEFYIWSEAYQRLFLDLPNLRLRGRVLEDANRRIADENRAVAFLFAGERRDFDFLDKVGKPLFDRCRSRHGALRPDECYGFFPALHLGGEASVEATRPVKAGEHFALLAQVGRATFVRVATDGRADPIRGIGSSEPGSDDGVSDCTKDESDMRLGDS